MTRNEIRAAFLADMTEVAPDLDPAAIGETDRFQDDLGLDSMDFLNFATALHEATGVDIPEQHYAKLVSLDDIVSYLERSGA